MIFRGPMRDLNTDQCPNLWRRQMRAHLGQDIAAAERFRNSPLYYKNPHTGRVTDRTKRNLTISSVDWRGFLPHLKWALCAKGLNFRFKIVTDERLINVFVGNESFMSRPKSTRQDLETVNGIKDLVGERFNLVIIRLGFLNHPNIAAAGVLLEALMLRESKSLPTWIVQEPQRAWVHSANKAAHAYIKANFKGVKGIVGPDEFDVDEILGQVEEGARELNDVEDDVEDEDEESADLEFEEAPVLERREYGGSSGSGGSGGLDDLMNDPTVMGGGKKKRGKW